MIPRAHFCISLNILAAPCRLRMPQGRTTPDHRPKPNRERLLTERTCFTTLHTHWRGSLLPGHSIHGLDCALREQSGESFGLGAAMISGRHAGPTHARRRRARRIVKFHPGALLENVLRRASYSTRARLSLVALRVACDGPLRSEPVRSGSLHSAPPRAQTHTPQLSRRCV